MAELDQSVVVCNLEGRILLYNERARELVRRLSRARGAAGAELIGLGRSIHGVIDPAADRARGRDGRAADRARRRRRVPAARFVTTRPRGT